MAEDGEEKDKEDEKAPTNGEGDDVSNKPIEFCSLYICAVYICNRGQS